MYETRKNVGLLYIVQKGHLGHHWQNCGLDGPEIDGNFMEILDTNKLPKRVQELLKNDASLFRSTLDRMTLAAISWTELRNNIFEIEEELNPALPGDQTLKKLLSGFRAQIEGHQGVGID